VPNNENHSTIPTDTYLELASGGGVMLRETAVLRGVQLRPAQRLRALKQLAASAQHADAGAAPDR